MHEDYCKMLLEDFLKTSMPTVKALVEQLKISKQNARGRHISLFQYIDCKKTNVTFDGDRFYLRGSVEYTNPQLTVEEAQGIVGTRLLEVCGNYFFEHGFSQPDRGEFGCLCEQLKKPPQGYIVPFLLNTDDVEADRYSINPLRNSLLTSGQSAFPAAHVKTDQLKVDEVFVAKYAGGLISSGEAELIAECLRNCGGSYVDFVDSVKYKQLEWLSKTLGMNLSLYALRMPLTTLETEGKGGLIHHIISESHRDYQAIEQAYTCMGRSMSKRTTLLTVPHSKKGYGSKRAARGKLRFENGSLQEVSVKYVTTTLYPNGIDPKDISIAQADDNFVVEGKKLAEYNYAETPSSPQFFLYSMGSPEDAAVWHGVGKFASPQLLLSASSARHACSEGRLIRNLKEKYGVETHVPLQFNLAPESMWRHPTHNNIDASIGCVKDIRDLVRWGMRVEHLSEFK